MASSCTEARNALLECLADSPCIASGRSIKECMDDPLCTSARLAYSTCKRGQVRCQPHHSTPRRASTLTLTRTHIKNWQLDMRKRIRGNLMKGGEEAESKAAES